MLKYTYPPRPETAVLPNTLNSYERFSMVAQVKGDGSCGVLLSESADTQQLYNRHQQVLTNVKIDREQLRGIHHGIGGSILVGEYLNKNKKHINGADFNHKYLLHDILVYKGKDLIGTTYMQRQAIIDELYRSKATDFDPFLLQFSEDVFVMKNFDKGFEDIYNECTQIEVYEGLVLKQKSAKLLPGTREVNNNKWQIKSRRQSRNYSF